MPESTTRVLLLRHGEVASHRGDVPVTEDGLVHAERAGRAIGQQTEALITVLFGGTRRTRETADAIVRGIGNGTRLDGPVNSFALRNPDMYVGGSRVNMVSSAETLAAQVPGMTEHQAHQLDWWAEFFTSSDRIGWWMNESDPPGDTTSDVTSRIVKFVRSLGDPGPLQGRTVVCVTHSPLLRSVLKHATGADPGEPGYVTGAEVLVTGGRLDIAPHAPLTQ